MYINVHMHKSLSCTAYLHVKFQNMVQSEQMPTTGEFEEMQVHVHTCIYFVYNNQVHVRYILNFIGVPY